MRQTRVTLSRPPPSAELAWISHLKSNVPLDVFEVVALCGFTFLKIWSTAFNLTWWTLSRNHYVEPLSWNPVPGTGPSLGPLLLKAADDGNGCDHEKVPKKEKYFFNSSCRPIWTQQDPLTPEEQKSSGNNDQNTWIRARWTDFRGNYQRFLHSVPSSSCLGRTGGSILGLNRENPLNCRAHFSNKSIILQQQGHMTLLLLINE